MSESVSIVSGPVRTPFWRRASRHPGFLLGGAISLFVLLTAALALIWTPFPVTELNIAQKLRPFSLSHPLGTDHFGRDIVSMLMVGAGNSVLVGIVAVGLGVGVGGPLGLLAAMRPGLISEAVMRASDLAFAFPALLTAVMITAIYGPGTVNSIIAIGIFNVPVFARLTRGVSLSVWQMEYVSAARAIGVPSLQIALRHMLPNIASPLIVQATIQFALAILAEAGLSYLGLGTQPPQPSWGKMLHEAQTMLYFAPTLAILPGISIAVTVLGLNLLGDGLRDLLDPKLRNASNRQSRGE
ncbi:ABC transporter permease [Nisaea acidiphila]|uniref:ABC transporter permease n=1 Tax=Nisaea acidiphila TaxID=1862145 RepID=A0A9J7ASK7_9PROT|nr:ABC transporter permease [Nisaea acidiphila]UUX50328.1 ABC transporter permease [Nisaea acidiphila]